jgi:hypothetical protein
LLAYCIVKYIDSEAEIEDYFERVKWLWQNKNY